MAQVPKESFWKEKQVLITGHTGFKGSWLSIWLNKLGANVTGIALAPDTNPNLFQSGNINELIDSHIIDIRDSEELDRAIVKIDPEIVFHLAAQPLVRKSYDQPLITHNTNIIGTANILNSLRDCKNFRVGIMITTDKVYKNKEWKWPYKETDELGGYDPYSSSKAAAEIIIDSFKSSFFNHKNIAISSARAGNIVGGGDWSMDRLIPDAIRAWVQEKDVLEIRSPDAIRPWQHVLEPLFGYIQLAESSWADHSLAGSYNFGPNVSEVATVSDIISLARESFGKGEIKFLQNYTGPHEAINLQLDITKAESILSWSPKLNLAKTIDLTMEWYKKFYSGSNAVDLCIEDINSFEHK